MITLTFQCAMTISTSVVQLFLQQENRLYVPLENGLRLQILPDISFLPECQKHHFAAFIQDTANLVVWDDQPTHILTRAKDIEDQLMSVIWNDSAKDAEMLSSGPSGKSTKQTYFHHTHAPVDVGGHNDILSGAPRKTVLVQPILTAMTLLLIVAAIGTGVRRMMIEVKVDHSQLRLALLLVAPLQIWLALVSQ